MATESVPLEIDVHQLSSWLDEGRELVLLDVREPVEHRTCRLEGTTLIPIRDLPQRFEELDSEALTVVYCHHGPRSSHAVSFLRQNGFDGATNLGGGIDAWSLYVDPSVPRY